MECMATRLAGTTIMITGGTGSFGSAMLEHLLESDVAEIRIFSRDEKKQDDMRHALQLEHPASAAKVRFFIGDVRDERTVRDAMYGVDYLFLVSYIASDAHRAAHYGLLARAMNDYGHQLQS